MQHVANLSDIPEEGTFRVEVESDAGTVEVALVRDEDGQLHAISDICSHGQVSLSDGDVEDCTIECWLHGSQFDLRTGKPLQLPATRAIPVYAIDVDPDTGAISVDIHATADADA